MSTLDQISTILSAHIETNLVRDLLRYYNTVKEEYCQEDWEKANLNAAKFVETIVRVLQWLSSPTHAYETGDVNVGGELENIMRLPRITLDDTLRMRIPRVALSVYDVRNNRGVAHSHTALDPNYMDSTFVVSACDWILSELVRFFGTSTPDEAAQLVTTLMSRKTPIVHEIDGDIVVLDPKIAYKDQLLLVLLKAFPNRVSNDDLERWTKPKKSSYVTTYLRLLEEARFVHRNAEGVKLTPTGIIEAEKLLSTPKLSK